MPAALVEFWRELRSATRIEPSRTLRKVHTLTHFQVGFHIKANYLGRENLRANQYNSSVLTDSLMMPNWVHFIWFSDDQYLSSCLFFPTHSFSSSSPPPSPSPLSSPPPSRPVDSAETSRSPFCNTEKRRLIAPTQPRLRRGGGGEEDRKRWWRRSQKKSVHRLKK